MKTVTVFCNTLVFYICHNFRFYDSLYRPISKHINTSVWIFPNAPFAPCTPSSPFLNLVCLTLCMCLRQAAAFLSDASLQWLPRSARQTGGETHPLRPHRAASTGEERYRWDIGRVFETGGGGLPASSWCVCVGGGQRANNCEQTIVYRNLAIVVTCWQECLLSKVLLVSFAPEDRQH